MTWTRPIGRRVTLAIWIAMYVVAAGFAGAAHADILDAVEAYDGGDYETALAEFRTAAEAGDATAQVALASMYQNGEGIRRNQFEAATWYRRAAEQGDAVAQINLSELYTRGDGVERDATEAYFWLAVAAAQGHPWALARLQDAAEKLSAPQREASDARVSNWTPLGPDSEILGAADIRDGETLEVAGHRFRLEGIDAPAPGTRCRLRGNDHDCGLISTSSLKDLTAGAEIVCQPRAGIAEDGTRYARCRVDGYDLSEGMVYTGWARADLDQTARYEKFEAESRAARRGMWRTD